jgi:hypothetical protein
MQKHFKYLKYVLRHKWYVFWACLEYGLLWRGLVHDLSKFRPSEWLPYANYFYGKKDAVQGSTGYMHKLNLMDAEFNYAWNAHQKRNSHHWQYYVLNEDEGKTVVLEMPLKDRKEMVADWRGAGKAQGKPFTWEWYTANKDKMQLAPQTRAWVEAEMAKLKNDYRIRGMLGIAD